MGRVKTVVLALSCLFLLLACERSLIKTRPETDLTSPPAAPPGGVRTVSTVDLLEPGSPYDIFVNDMMTLRGRANFTGTGDSDIDFTWQFNDGAGWENMPTGGPLDLVIKGPSTANPELNVKVDQAAKEDWRYIIPAQADSYQVRLQVIDHNNGDAAIESSAVTVSATTYTGLNTRAVPPSQFVNTRFPDNLSGATTNVGSGDNLQTALNAAACGDTLKLAVGATFIGNFVLQRNECGCVADPTKWIMIRSAAADSDLPDEDERFDPAVHGSFAPIILTDGAQATLESDRNSTAANTVDCYYFFGIKFECTGADGVENFWCVTLGDENNGSVAREVEYFIFDRVWFHANELKDFRRALYVIAAKQVAVINTYIDGWSSSSGDCQGILVRQGSGFEFVNNFIDGSAEPIMFGGVRPKTNQVPSDIIIRRSQHSHPNNWNPEHVDYDGRSRSIKNLLEFKNGMRAIVEGNQLNNNWAGSQGGTALVITPRGEQGCTWCTVHDIVFQYNLIFDVGRGFNLAGRDDIDTSETSYGIHIENNLWYKIGQGIFDGDGDGFLQPSGGQHDQFVVHNTFSKVTRFGLFWANGNCNFVVRDLTLANNGMDVDNETFVGDTVGPGQPAIDKCLAVGDGEKIVENNGVVSIDVTETCNGTNSSNDYPTSFVCVTGSEAVQFTNRAANDFSLQGGSPWKGAGNDGKDIGADIAEVLNKTSGVE